VFENEHHLQAEQMSQILKSKGRKQRTERRRRRRRGGGGGGGGGEEG